MNTTLTDKNNRQVAYWLLVGVAMIMVQVLLGGITRLTESGLSITEWKPITGFLPPLTDAAWQTEFDKYRHTDQFQFVHAHFSLKEFKFIFFWEWFHRVWARLMGLVFLIGFIYFLVKRKMNKSMVAPMVVLFFLGAMQGAVGWMMVKSGLVPEMYFVGHVELTTHFIAALILLSYVFWFALKLIVPQKHLISNKRVYASIWGMVVLLFFQLVYGGFMAGLKAAAVAPTWPDIQGTWIPNLTDLKLQVHFIHRGLGYMLFLLCLVLFFSTRHLAVHPIYGKARIILLFAIFLQVLLGIGSLLKATQPDVFVVLGVLHQFNAMIVLLTLLLMLFVVRSPKQVV